MAKSENRKKVVPSINTNLKISKKTFETDDGTELTYYDYRINIGEQEFTLKAKDEDKKLLNYLLNQEFKNVESDDDLPY